MIWKFAAAFALALVPLAAALADAVQGEIDLEIVIGRTEVMQDQTARGLVILGLRQASSDGEQLLPSDPQRDQYARLAELVVRYNNLRDLACGNRVIQHPLCVGQRFMPMWFTGGRRPYAPPDDLKRMANEMQNQTAPLWMAVCDRARLRTGDKDFCSIE